MYLQEVHLIRPNYKEQVCTPFARCALKTLSSYNGAIEYKNFFPDVSAE